MEKHLVSHIYTAKPNFEFCLNKEYSECVSRLIYLNQLQNDFTEFINQGLTPDDANDLIRTMLDKYLSSRNYFG